MDTMMATTHLLIGLLLALPVAVVVPSLAEPILIGTAVGSLLPDLDLYYGHRRTLHYPTVGLLVAIPTLLTAILVLHPFVVAGSAVIIAAVLHARLDIYGGGLELRPWAGESQRAVYDHLRNRWIAPRRYVRYDGAPEDVATAAIIAVPLLLFLDGFLWWIVTAAVLISLVYGLIRKPLVDLGIVILRHVPRPVLSWLPMRYLEDELSEQV